ncbi:methyltransferase domain-containing protein [Candidatus Parcubacteria bacterium]|nr:methyltransferase domain-containing protein [Candidatus Parcubacteria bacterium]
MKYFFVLGTNPTLSIAELSAVFGLNNKNTECPTGRLASENVFLIESNKAIDGSALIKKIGGTIKIGIINQEALQFGGQAGIKDYDGIKNNITEMLKDEQPEGKFKFGISYYGKAKFNIKPLAMEIKNYLRERGISCRWVTSREPTLSSVVVEQNKLIGKGIEIVLIESEGEVLIGRTLAVQPFKELSFRDYGRPARDDYSGMLPPKLAQIIINLAALPPLRMGVRGDLFAAPEGEVSLLDPFCGSGTILTEAMLMGCKNLIGSDISAKAIDDTKKNIEWIIKNYELGIRNYELLNINAAELSKHIKPNSIDTIATEPYLGPQRGAHDINKTIKELENLYGKTLAEFKKVLKKDGRVVMTWPIFRITHNAQRITPDLSGFKIINPIPEYLRNDKKIKLTDRSTIIYGRERQKIWREITVLTPNS